MDLLCDVCDRSIIKNETEYMNSLTTLRKNDDKSLYKKYTIIKINLVEVNKKLNDDISIQNKNFEFYFFNCEFLIEFDNKFLANIKSNYFSNTGIININRYLFI